MTSANDPKDEEAPLAFSIAGPISVFGDVEELINDHGWVLFQMPSEDSRIAEYGIGPKR